MMEEHAKNLVNQGVPWNRNARWPVIGIAGIVLLVLGIYIFADKSGAASTVLQVVALVLLASSAAGIIAEFRTDNSDTVLFNAFRAGIGITIGAIGTLRWFWDYIDDRPLRLILGWGLLAYAVVYLIGLGVLRERAGIQMGSLVTTALTIVLGVVLLLSDDATKSGTLNLLGAVLVIFGLLFIAAAYLRFRSGQNVGTAAAAR
ncbi:MAG TPA: DUF308 domain-containing protein [Thermomicrobiales bacterium]|nr:DUF308 domain-containing protein [Thermomicrobiales bacterium]